MQKTDMRIFYSDLDNTLIYSRKHDIGPARRCAEIYQNREISFMTAKTHRLLKQLKEQMYIVPVTTRTTEQYKRLDLGIGRIPLALTCNGGILLADGREDASWYAASRNLISGCKAELTKAKALLEQDKNRSLEVRDIRGLFLFTKSEHPQETVHTLKESLDTGLLDVFSNGIKIYAVPKQLNKGTAIRRLNERLNPSLSIAAGDSEFDIPMLLQADLALAPKSLKGPWDRRGNIHYIPDENQFSDELLAYIFAKYYG